jgi:photosystem II stability/assembly factor-like uncharacterized protein
MIAMMIALVGMLALGSLTIASLDSNTVARERVQAVNLGSRIMEEWIASPTDALPTPSCNPALGAPLAAGVTTSCKPLVSTAKLSYDIYVSVANPRATMPVGMPAGSLPALRILGPGLRVTSILVDRANSSVLYAGTDGGGLYRSADAGANWARVGNIGYIRVNDIKQDSFGNIYIGTDVGVMTNQGVGGTWVVRNSGLLTGPVAIPPTPSYQVFALIIDPVTPTTLYAGTNGGLFKSINSGVTWGASSGNPASIPPTNITNLKVNALAIDPLIPATLYAGTDVNAGVDPYSGVFKSTDGGATWNSIKATAPNNVNALAFAPAALYAGTDVYTATGTVTSGVDIYTNAVGWDPLVNPNDSFTLALTMNGASPISGSRGTNTPGSRGQGAGVYDSGSLLSWFSAASNQAQRRIYSIAIDPNDSTIWYAGTDDGVLKSTNSGSSWTAINNGIGIVPQEKVVKVSWQHKGITHSIVLTHISRRPY